MERIGNQSDIRKIVTPSTGDSVNTVIMRLRRKLLRMRRKQPSASSKNARRGYSAFHKPIVAVCEHLP